MSLCRIVLLGECVPEDQISRQLGHTGTGARITTRYGEWSPDYLKDSSAALDTWIRRVMTAGQ